MGDGTNLDSGWFDDVVKLKLGRGNWRNFGVIGGWEETVLLTYFRLSTAFAAKNMLWLKRLVHAFMVRRCLEMGLGMDQGVVVNGSAECRAAARASALDDAC